MTLSSYDDGFLGETSTGRPGRGMSMGNMSTHSSNLPYTYRKVWTMANTSNVCAVVQPTCSIPGLSGLKSALVSTCSVINLVPTRGISCQWCRTARARCSSDTVFFRSKFKWSTFKMPSLCHSCRTCWRTPCKGASVYGINSPVRILLSLGGINSATPCPWLTLVVGLPCAVFSVLVLLQRERFLSHPDFPGREVGSVDLSVLAQSGQQLNGLHRVAPLVVATTEGKFGYVKNQPEYIRRG